jgi:hypothetical protein
VAEQAPQSEATIERIQRWMQQDSSPARDVSHETSQPEPKEPEVETESSDSDDYEPQPNAQLEGDDAPEPAEINSFSELAKRLEIGEEDLAKHLKVQGRDGEEVSLFDVLSSYRAPQPDKIELEKQRTRLTELESGREDYSRAAEEMRAAAQDLARRLKAQEPDWATLQQRDPQQYMAKRLEWMEHVRQLELADRHLQVTRQQQMVEQQRQVETFRREQAQKLRAAVPAWSDTKVMQAELESVSQWLVKQGIAENEVANLTDHRDWLIARKAMLYDQLQAKKPQIVDKVKALPKFVPPGASSGADRGSSARTVQREQEMTERLRETGSVRDAAALIEHQLKASAKRAAGRTLAAARRS